LSRVRETGEKAAGPGELGKNVDFGDPRSSRHEPFGGTIPFRGLKEIKREDAGTGKSEAFEEVYWVTV
jgi:hypothetical protein